MASLEPLWLDLKHACRALSASRGFAVTATLSLALGIGTSTAAFSVWDAVLLRSLPVRDPASLAVVTTRNAGSQLALSHAGFTFMRDRATTLDGLAAFRVAQLNVAVGNATERVAGMLVSGEYFDVLGVRMAQGSPIAREDDRDPGTGGPRGLVAVVSHEFWAARLGSDRGVIGRAIRLHGRPATIVGVAPRGFNGTATGSIPEVYVPMMFATHVFGMDTWLTNPRNLWLRLIGRVKHGVPFEQAQAEMTLVFRQFHRDVILPIANTEQTQRRAREAAIVLEPGHAGLLELGQTARPTVLAVVGLVGLMLLAACVNVAGLMAGRAERLHRDTAICLALGATRRRIWSRYFAESAVIAAAGSLLGLVIASWTRDALSRMVAVNGRFDLTLDWRVLAVSAGLGAAVTVLLSIVAGWSSTRLGVMRALKGGDVHARLWLRKGLIAGQLALSLIVLVSAALFTQTLTRLGRVDTGFDREHLLIGSIAPAGYEPGRRRAFFDAVLADVRSIPGVTSAALAGDEPLGVRTGWTMTVPRDGEARQVSASISLVSPGYFATMGIPLLRGRDFDAADLGLVPQPIVVNENFVRTHLPGIDALAARITGNGTMTFEIVGIVRDSASIGLRDLDQQLIYVPGGDGVLHVRTAVPADILRTSIEQAVHRLDPDVPLFNVRTVEQHLDRLLLRERTFMALSSAFGAIALVLAGIGIYGVVATTVTRRTRELGIRLALGAGPGRTVWLVLRDAALLLIIGAAVGLPGAIAINRLQSTLLFGVDPGDVPSLAGATLVLTAVAAVAAWIPGRRAARIDPIVALKAE